MSSLELRIPPVVLGLGLGAIMYATARLAPGFAWAVPAGAFLAAGLALAGLSLALWGVIAFRRARTTVNPLDPAATAQLVVAGIYRKTRNPMYLGMLLMLLGWGVFLAHPPACALGALFVPLMNRLQIVPEERILTARFGPAYAAYLSAVRRWL